MCFSSILQRICFVFISVTLFTFRVEATEVNDFSSDIRKGTPINIEDVINTYIKYLRSTVETDPKAARARLELAVILNRYGRYQAALEQLDLLLEQPIPPEVVKKIEIFKQQLLLNIDSELDENDQSVRGLISVNAGFSSNANRGPKDNHIDDINLTLPEFFAESSDRFLNYGVQLKKDGLLREFSDIPLEYDLSFQLTGQNFDKYQTENFRVLEVAGGLQLRDQFNYRLFSDFRSLILNRDHLADALKIGFSVGKQYQRKIYNLSLSSTKVDYSSMRYSKRDSDIYDAEVNFVSLSDQSCGVFGADFGYTKNLAKGSFSYQQYSLGLYCSNNQIFNGTVDSSITAFIRDYDEVNYSYYNTVRRDTRLTLELKYKKPLSKNWALKSKFKNVMNYSNHDLYSYKNTILEVGLERKF